MASVASNPSHVTAQGVYSTGPTLAGDVDLLSVDEENLVSAARLVVYLLPASLSICICN